MKKVISLLIVFIFLGLGIDVVKAQNLNILPIDFKNADQSNYSPYIGYRGGQIKFNLNFSGGPTDADYQIYVYLINEATGKIDFEQIINPTVPTSKWSSTSQVPVVIDIPSDSKASVWTAYRAVVALKKNDKVLVLNNPSKILKSLPHNESPMGDYYKSINTVYLENGNYIVARILITNSNIYTLPSENPNTISAGSNLPITLKFEAKNPEWTYDGIICVGNFFSNTHTTYYRLGIKHNPVITLVPAKVKDASFSIKDWIVYNTATSNNISDSDTWRGSISLPVSFNIPKNTKPGKYEIHVIPSVSQPFCAIPSMPGNGTSISMLQSTAQPSNLVGTVNITNGDINSSPITVNKIIGPESVPAGSVFNFNLNFVAGKIIPVEGREFPIIINIYDENEKIVLSNTIDPLPYPPSKWSGQVTIPVSIRIPDSVKPGNYSVRLSTNNQLLVWPFVTGNGVMESYQGNIKVYEVGKLLVTQKNNTVVSKVYSSKLPSLDKWTGPISATIGSTIFASLNFNSVPTRYEYGVRTWSYGNSYGTSNEVNASIYVKFIDSKNEAKLFYLMNPTIPTSEWKVGKLSIPVNIKIPLDLTIGTYTVQAGLYGILGVGGPVGTINITNINNVVINPNPKVINPVETNNNVSTVNVNPTNTNLNYNNQNTSVNVVANPVIVPVNLIPTSKITINQWNVNSTHVGTNAQATLSSSLVFSTINFSINFQGGPTAGDKRVFVHFVDSSGNIRFSADLSPSMPSSKWTSSSNNWVSADVEVPSNIPTGTYNVYAGLYSDSRVELNPGPNVSVDNQTRYKIGTVTISPAPVTVKSSTLVGNVISAVARFFGVSFDK